MHFQGLSMNISFSDLDIYKESQIVPYLEGESGIGKTSIIEQYAKAKEMDCIIMGVASLDHIEFYGRTVSTDIVAGFNDTKFTVFNKSIPSWVSRILQNDQKNRETLLFIDELNRAEPQNLQSLMNLILKKEFGSDSIQLPDSLFIVAAGNPIDDGDYLVESLDKAMLSRMAIVKVRATLESWKKNYALSYDIKQNRQRIHPLIINYLEDNRADFLLKSAEDNMSDPGMDPRRWDMISRLLYTYEKSNQHSSNLVTLLSTVSSKEVAPKLMSYINKSNVLSFSKIEKQLAGFLSANDEKEFTSYLLKEKSNNPAYLDLIESIQSNWDKAQPVTQVNILTSAFYALKAVHISDDFFAIILKIASEEHIMSIKIGLDDAETFIDNIDKKYNLGISQKVSDGLVKHIDQTNPFIASLIQA
ncbi:MAG: MoxR-like ATPases [uncultured Sulfurovum sp.]|uniref:MoxR-like ATPases n=1 Tax=uncultured Sulfurovum sp. TaxID=269237 RepID=A0A6S6S6L2_9BACT|nr:MAG: MoxR-like ATPases [uncultured Sulfurovum sp.]